MRTAKLPSIALLLSLTIALFWTAAGLGGHHGCPQCGASSECCYQNVTVHRCKQVPDVQPIKKIVYELKEVPYCSHKLSHCHDCSCCPECKACPQYKRQLVKREIICGEKQGTKCIVEESVELVAVPCSKCGCKSHCR